MALASLPESKRTVLPWTAALSDLPPLSLALCLIVCMTAVRATGTVDSDVAWRLWIAGQLHAGAHLYRDIIEVNPPLWFWMAVPLDYISSLLHVRIEPVLVCMVSALAALSLTATNRLLSHLPASRRRALLACAALIIVGMPWVNTGEREQLALIGAVPYAALIAVRRDGRPVSPVLGFAIGSLAGVGFALKHYFLIVPILLELWPLTVQRHSWRVRRPETIALMGVGVLYAAAILLFAREFLTNIVPLDSLSYGSLRPPSIRYLFGAHAILALTMLILLAANARALAKADASLSKSFAIAASGFVLAYFIQGRGWTYHAIPMLGCASMSIAALLAETEKPSRSLRLCTPVLLAFTLILAADEQMHPVNPTPDVVDALAGASPGDAVGFLAVDTAVPWSVVLQHRFRYPSRYMGYWMLNAVVDNEHRPDPDPRLSALGRQVVSDTVHDFACMPPERIIVVRPPNGEHGFDILKFFMRNRRFAELMSHYRVRTRTSVETFERTSPLLPSTTPCRRVN